MGTTCDVTVVGGADGLTERARARVEELEARWSRFRPDSELTRLNRRSGQPTALSADSYLLVDHAVAGWRWTAPAWASGTPRRRRRPTRKVPARAGHVGLTRRNPPCSFRVAVV